VFSHRGRIVLCAISAKKPTLPVEHERIAAKKVWGSPSHLLAPPVGITSSASCASYVRVSTILKRALPDIILRRIQGPFLSSGLSRTIAS